MVIPMGQAGSVKTGFLKPSISDYQSIRSNMGSPLQGRQSRNSAGRQLRVESSRESFNQVELDL